MERHTTAGVDSSDDGQSHDRRVDYYQGAESTITFIAIIKPYIFREAIPAGEGAESPCLFLGLSYGIIQEVTMTKVFLPLIRCSFVGCDVDLDGMQRG